MGMNTGGGADNITAIITTKATRKPQSNIVKSIKD
jgi:hypothetical protein